MPDPQDPDIRRGDREPVAAGRRPDAAAGPVPGAGRGNLHPEIDRDKPIPMGPAHDI